MKMSFLVPFEKWEIDYVGEVHLYSSKDMAYIVVTTKYLTKWAEAKAVKMNMAANAATFIHLKDWVSLDSS